MDKAVFELVGNVGKIELKDIKGGKKLAILSVATSERWKRDDGEWNEKTYWHRVVVFPGSKVSRIEASVQKGTRVRLTGQVRPTTYETDRGETRYAIEFVVGPFGDLEALSHSSLNVIAADFFEPFPGRLAFGGAEGWREGIVFALGSKAGARQDDVDILGKALDEAIPFGQGGAALEEQLWLFRHALEQGVDRATDPEILLDRLRRRPQLGCGRLEQIEAISRFQFVESGIVGIHPAFVA